MFYPCLEFLVLASEEDRLIEMGLSTEVVQTILFPELPPPGNYTHLKKDFNYVVPRALI